MKKFRYPTNEELLWLAQRTAPPQVTHHCPNCEAAARERDAAYEDARQMQARLQRLIDADDHICERCGEVIPFEHPCNCQKCWNEQVGMYVNLRARLEALCVEMETDDRAGKLAHWIAAIRAIAEKEAK